ncbi:protoporphyrinogen oxidase [Natronobeatus ordinarius]|uniref:protoporphyrinogen oxidase n=1 Tax=Natronobeatus ordinarius TaxID=2963433 RepID=UPI0020CE2C63|nr:protoporphyrinogen oxidase [Natronobeatus ordinarius]
MSHDRPRVGIVGGGLTGLALSYYLDAHGVESVAFEATDAPGGVIRSGRTNGTVVEYGPQRMRLSGSLADLVSDLGLAGELVAADDDLPLFVYADGKLREVPTSASAFVRTDALSWRGKLRLLAEPLTDPASPDETAAELFTRKFGPEAYHTVIGPLFGGIFGSDPARMPARHALEGLIRLEQREGNLLVPAVKRLARNGDRAPAVVFEDGNQRLPEALYEATRDRVHLETPVESIRERDDGDGYVLEADGDRAVVDEVVVTTPADASAQLLEAVAPDAATRLRELRYNPLTLVYLEAEAPKRGFGYQIRKDEPFHTLGVSWNGVAFGRDDLVTCFFGGMWEPELVSEPEGRLARLACAEYEAVTGCEAEFLEVERMHRGFPAHDDTWDALDGLELPDGLHLATNYTSRMGIPSRVSHAKRLAGQLAGTSADA